MSENKPFVDRHSNNDEEEIKLDVHVSDVPNPSGDPGYWVSIKVTNNTDDVLNSQGMRITFGTEAISDLETSNIWFGEESQKIGYPEYAYVEQPDSTYTFIMAHSEKYWANPSFDPEGYFSVVFYWPNKFTNDELAALEDSVSISIPEDHVTGLEQTVAVIASHENSSALPEPQVSLLLKWEDSAKPESQTGKYNDTTITATKRLTWDQETTLTYLKPKQTVTDEYDLIVYPVERCFPTIKVHENLITNVTTSVGTSYSANPEFESIVKTHGHLQLKSGQIQDENQDVVQLRGLSTHGLQWHADIVNPASLYALALPGDKGGWDCNIIRAAMYTSAGAEGYLNPANREQQLDKVREIIRTAVELGIYVLVDWHILHEQTIDQEPLPDDEPFTSDLYREEAKGFFSEIIAEFGHLPNLLFEIANEPIVEDDWSVIKIYADDLIQHIRAEESSKDAASHLIIVGTPYYSQRVDLVIDNEVEMPENVLYTFHFYAGSHPHPDTGYAAECFSCKCGPTDNKEHDYFIAAYDAGIPIFVTEFGTTCADGGGVVFEDGTNAWLGELNDKKVSWINWNLSDDDYGTEANPGPSEQMSPVINYYWRPQSLFATYDSQAWGDEFIRESGLFIKAQLNNAAKTDNR